MQPCSPFTQPPTCTSPSSSPIWTSSHLLTLSSFHHCHLLFESGPPSLKTLPWLPMVLGTKFQIFTQASIRCPAPPGPAQLHFPPPVQTLSALATSARLPNLCSSPPLGLCLCCYLFLEFPPSPFLPGENPFCQSPTQKAPPPGSFSERHLPLHKQTV